MKVGIVGLGLIGGSMALALRGFEDHTIVGVDVSQPTLRFARERGVCDRVTEDAGEAIEGADVVMLAIHPQGILDFLKAYRDRFKPGCLVTDVCGVKSAIMEGAECLPEGVDFIGGHPMAGTEFSGIQHAFAEMFQDSHLILTPRETSTEAHIALMERLARHIRKKERDENESVGLWNVHQRLINYYGEAAGLLFKRSVWGGLLVSFQIMPGGEGRK